MSKARVFRWNNTCLPADLLPFPGKSICRSSESVIAIPWKACLPLLWEARLPFLGKRDCRSFGKYILRSGPKEILLVSSYFIIVVVYDAIIFRLNFQWGRGSSSSARFPCPLPPLADRQGHSPFNHRFHPQHLCRKSLGAASGRAANSSLRRSNSALTISRTASRRPKRSSKKRCAASCFSRRFACFVFLCRSAIVLPFAFCKVRTIYPKPTCSNRTKSCSNRTFSLFPTCSNRTWAFS